MADLHYIYSHLYGSSRTSTTVELAVRASPHKISSSRHGSAACLRSACHTCFHQRDPETDLRELEHPGRPSAMLAHRWRTAVTLPRSG